MNFSSVDAPAPTNNKVTIFDVQGNIAAGKSTLLELAASDPTRLIRLLFKDKAAVAFTHVCVVPEPIAQWTSVGAQETDMLKAMYTNPKANGFACQLNIINTQLAAIGDAMRCALTNGSSLIGGACGGGGVGDSSAISMLVITERSTEASKYIFAKSMHDNDLLSSAEWKIYCDSFDAAHALWRESVRQMFPGGVSVQSGGTIYLLVAPEEAQKRAKKRGRAAEADVKLDLFQRIDGLHQKLYAKRNNIIRTPLVVMVDSTLLRSIMTGKLDEKHLLMTTVKQQQSTTVQSPRLIAV